MINIKFTETEKNELINFYQNKLSETLKKADEIKAVLNKLQGKTNKNNREKESSLGTKNGKRFANKIKWGFFVPQIMKQKSPITAREILVIAGKKYNVPVNKKTYNSLSQILRNMKIAGKVNTKMLREGKRKKLLYSLVSK
jgi:hypothetical protein